MENSEKILFFIYIGLLIIILSPVIIVFLASSMNLFEEGSYAFIIGHISYLATYGYLLLVLISIIKPIYNQVKRKPFLENLIYPIALVISFLIYLSIVPKYAREYALTYFFIYLVMFGFVLVVNSIIYYIQNRTKN